MKSLRILLLSSCPRSQSAGLADDMIVALQNVGHHVDFNYPEFENDKLIADIQAKPSIFFRIIRKLGIVTLINKLGIVLKAQNKQIIFGADQRMFYNIDERAPLLDPYTLLNRLQGKEYDMIITLFWTNVFNSTTLKALYDQFHCPIFIYAVDMAPMTGGCFYIGNCEQYMRECRDCPVFGGIFGCRTYNNFRIKKDNYKSIDVCLSANTWGSRFADKTHLFKQISISSIIINDKVFYPKEKKDTFLYNIIPPQKKFIMLARCTGDEKRKGFNYLIESINYFISLISSKERKSILLLLIGKTDNKYKQMINVDTMQLGFLDVSRLVDAYSYSNVFLCPSTLDGGPSMINQSIMCGTPVVSFDSGTAIDVIHNGCSGFKVQLKDSKAFGKAIHQLFVMSSIDYKKMRKSSREIALHWNSPSAFVKQVESVYHSFKH